MQNYKSSITTNQLAHIEVTQYLEHVKVYLPWPILWKYTKSCAFYSYLYYLIYFQVYLIQKSIILILIHYVNTIERETLCMDHLYWDCNIQTWTLRTPTNQWY